MVNETTIIMGFYIFTKSFQMESVYLTNCIITSRIFPPLMHGSKETLFLTTHRKKEVSLKYYKLNPNVICNGCPIAHFHLKFYLNKYEMVLLSEFINKCALDWHKKGKRNEYQNFHIDVVKYKNVCIHFSE